jgi:pilus assembly protein CpaC
MTRPTRQALLTALILLICLCADSKRLAAGGQVQTPQAAITRITLTAGRSTVIETDFDVTRIAVTNTAVADAVVVQPREILIDGKGAGTVSLIAWGIDRREQYDVVVSQEVSNLQQQLQALFPGEDIRVNASDEAIILSGQVSSNPVMLRAGEIAQATSAKARVINMLQLPGGAESQQVILQVRFAEVNRRVMTELGVSLFTGATGNNNNIGRLTTGQFSAPTFDKLERTVTEGQVVTSGEITFGDFLNLFHLQHEIQRWRPYQSAAVNWVFSEPRRAEPDRLQRTGRELPGGRRDSGACCPGRHWHGDRRVQGVRHSSELPSDDCW